MLFRDLEQIYFLKKINQTSGSNSLNIDLSSNVFFTYLIVI